MVNKNDLVEALAPRLGGRSAAALAVETIVDVVLREVAAGESVTITGFGTFEPVERAPRTGRNPHTGEPVPIPATRTPRFRPSSYFKAVVSDPLRLPTHGLAGVRTHAVEGDGNGADHWGASTGRAGAPASIRRSEAPAQPEPEPERGPSEPEAPAPPSRGGQPATVRAERPAPEEPPAVEPARDPNPAAGRSIGGDQITADMISAKKAARARAASQQGGEPEPGKKKKKKKKGKKDGKSAKKGS
ncbi:hypothetical protein GCM10009584_07780 [Ornithinimicrobium humiphilum]|uniref:DNA-binding protein HU-beta n=1 Tax=Ornithinimicrobium humiphilum TaxID=125288 RepID=A0A543KQD5_9MICO|nr:HU family DNA-binding protein [Ornithinimicrobium humiphilum]TQM97291.1 DNA-binding protein HU-beta [Ornithinimicrobium humiphilum]